MGWQSRNKWNMRAVRAINGKNMAGIRKFPKLIDAIKRMGVKVVDIPRTVAK